MNLEPVRIATQLRHAFSGKPWHGSPLGDLLAGITAEQAQMRPLPNAHSIWELVLHIDIWARVALDATQGVPMPKLWGTEKDWPIVLNDEPAEWTTARDHLFQTGEQLAQAMEGFTGPRLQETVPGREYDFYYLFHGIVQHSLYHGGQIAMLGKALRSGVA